MSIYRTLSKTVTLKSDEDLKTNPFAHTSVLVVGDIEELSLEDLITRATESLARIKTATWQAVHETIANEQMATVQWLCESCLDVGFDEDAVMRRHGENVCQDCAENIDWRDAEESAIPREG